MLFAETNYPVYNKKMLTIILTLKKWPYYLMNACHPIIIRSNHKLLKYFKLPQRLSQRQTHWNYTLAYYKFKIEYKKSDLNYIINMLSCNPGYKFDKNKLNDFKNITLFPEFCFHVDKTPISLKDRITDT